MGAIPGPAPRFLLGRANDPAAHLGLPRRGWSSAQVPAHLVYGRNRTKNSSAASIEGNTRNGTKQQLPIYETSR
jgi:hypothetical protein